MEPENSLEMNEFADASRHIRVQSEATSINESRRLQIYLQRAVDLAEAAQRLWEDHGVRGDGIYVGTSGVALALAKLGSSLEHSGDKKGSIWIQRASELSRRALARGPGSSILDGAAGVFLAKAIIADVVGDVRVAEKAAADFFRVGIAEGVADAGAHKVADEVLYGRAGYILGALGLADLASIKDRQLRETLTATARDVATALLERGRNKAKQLQTNGSLMYEWHGTLYLGAAHGLLGILFALCRLLRRKLLDEPAKREVLDSLRLVLAMEQSPGAFGTQISSPGSGHRQSKCLCHWCHGAAGVAMVFSEAARTFPEAAVEFAEAARRCGDVVAEYGLLTKGVGLCHGIAGSGYALLAVSNCEALPDAVRTEARARAFVFADFIANVGLDSDLIHTPDRPGSLFEGVSGAVYFLCDLVRPVGNAGMPIFEKFSII